MVFGIIAAVLLLCLAGKYIARKCNWKKLVDVLTKSHKFVGILLIILVAVHILSTFKVWQMRNIFLMVSGIVLTSMIMVLAAGFMLRKRTGAGWIKIHRILAGAAVVLLLVHVAVYYVDFMSYQKNIKAVSLDGITAEGLSDGVYEGSCDAGYIRAKVRVTVENEKIASIDLYEHKNERGGRAEAVVDEIEKQQTTAVESVSGATNSSVVIKKAVENALENR